MINIIKEFEINDAVFKQLLSQLSSKEYLWREHEGKWNLLEVVCHLYDEERDDFKTRFKSVLDDPDKPFPPIDPVGWVTDRNYSEQDFNTMVAKFLLERKASIAWLQSLENPPLENSYMHPKLGPMSGRFILSNWLAHDYLHIRQILRIKYNYLQYTSEQDLSYAGEW
ncbi:MAG: DinB family protein [Bacteroidetes bacterium]|nr:DinB family protein [Bacteroidota bacterium]